MKRVVGGVEEAVVRTTPEAIDLQATFRRMLDAGDRACAMEVSSHALALDRVDGDPLRRRRVHQPDPGPPRLPRRHGGLLRRQAAAVHRAAGAERAVVNVDDPYGDRLAGRDRARSPSRPPAPSAPTARRRRRASTPPARASAASDPRRRGRVSLPLPGRFNVENALCAIACAARSGSSSATRPRRSPTPSGCPGASSRSTRASRSPSSSTTRTRPTRSRTCSWPRAR